ncbi:MAG: 6-phosphogluconolactonase [Myxococcales bacterium]|nr:6-phosphogluconolactonase [Myxococcales bacterium]
MSAARAVRGTSVFLDRGGQQVIAFDSREAVMEAAAEQVLATARLSIANRGRFTWALSGGSTPAGAYQRLATDRFSKRIDWERVWFFWGDERCVPPDDEQSNYRMAKQALLDAVAPPVEHVHRMRGEDPPAQGAARYEALLREAFELEDDAPPPPLDLVFLGMGEDGHTASLFPGTPVVHERARWVCPNQAPDGTSRLTLTPAVLNAAAQVVFLVVGAAKAARLGQVLRSRPGASDVAPAGRVDPARGAVRWLVDAEAAAQLKGR